MLYITQKKCNSCCVDVSVFNADARAFAEVKKAIDSAGPIDVLVCNQGVFTPQEHVVQEMEEIRFMIEVNLIGTFHLIKAALPSMKKDRDARGLASIAIMSSRAGQLETTDPPSKLRITTRSPPPSHCPLILASDPHAGTQPYWTPRPVDDLTSSLPCLDPIEFATRLAVPAFQHAALIALPPEIRFSPGDTNLVLREFEKCGVILHHVLGPRNAKWMHIPYQMDPAYKPSSRSKDDNQYTALPIAGSNLTYCKACFRYHHCQGTLKLSNYNSFAGHTLKP